MLNTSTIIVIALIVIFFLIIGLIWALCSSNKYKTKVNEQIIKNNKLENEVIEKENQYENLKNEVIEQEEKEKEVAKRRRITKSVKQSVLERDNYTCQICGISKGYIDRLKPGLGDYLLLEIDHIESVANGGTGSDEANLQVLCWRCNRKKGSKKTNDEIKSMIDYGLGALENY